MAKYLFEAFDASLQRLAHAAYGLADLHADLTRLAFLLGSAGEQLLHPHST
jgi:hypothetical protein